MAYVPPTGNSILFNFRGVYGPPTGNAIVLEFAVVTDPGGGSGEEQVSGYRHPIIAFEEEEWFPKARRNFAPVIGLGGTEALPFKRWIRFDFFQETIEPLPWRNPIRKTPMIAYRGQRRRAAQIIG